jgi:hypothetical protein
MQRPADQQASHKQLSRPSVPLHGDSLTLTRLTLTKLTLTLSLSQTNGGNNKIDALNKQTLTTNRN